MPFVLDASTAASWAFEDEDDSRAARAFVRIEADVAVVPPLWKYEVLNTLIVSERRKRITSAETAVFQQDLSEMLIEVDSDESSTALLRLARDHNLSVYDAAYLELSLRRGLPLATLDKVLRKAAKKEGVALL